MEQELNILEIPANIDVTENLTTVKHGSRAISLGAGPIENMKKTVIYPVIENKEQDTSGLEQENYTQEIAETPAQTAQTEQDGPVMDIVVDPLNVPIQSDGISIGDKIGITPGEMGYVPKEETVVEVPTPEPIAQVDDSSQPVEVIPKTQESAEPQSFIDQDMNDIFASLQKAVQDAEKLALEKLAKSQSNVIDVQKERERLAAQEAEVTQKMSDADKKMREAEEHMVKAQQLETASREIVNTVKGGLQSMAPQQPTLEQQPSPVVIEQPVAEISMEAQMEQPKTLTLTPQANAGIPQMQEQQVNPQSQAVVNNIAA